RIARLGQRRARRRNMQHLIEAVALARVDDGDAAPVGEAELAGIAGLTAALRIEHRTIEAYAALVDGDDARLAGGQVGVVAEQQLGHRSSHCGTGSLRSRRKAGLNSFDW